MRVVRDHASLSALTYPELRALIEQVIAAIAADEPYDASVHGYFVVVEPGDAAAVLDSPLGFSILRSRVDDRRFDEPGFHRPWEVLEEHASCYEMVIVLSDDGAGVEVLIPKVAGIDPDLLALCHRHATRAQEPAP